MLIAHISDLHIRPLGEFAARIVDTNMLAERALRAVAAFRPAPDCVIVSGDVTECGRVAEYQVAARLLTRLLPMPVYVVPGNHDRRENFRAGLAALPGVTADPDFIQYVVDDFPLRIVMLDSVVPGAGHGELCASRLAFLEASLAAAPGKPTVIVLHHPPLMTGVPGMDVIPLRSTAAVAEIIARHPQVRVVLAGHHHRAIVAPLHRASVCVAPATVGHQSELRFDPETPAFFTLEPAAYWMHRWSVADGLVSHLAFVESYPGPYPFLVDADYPGYTPKT